MSDDFDSDVPEDEQPADVIHDMLARELKMKDMPKPLVLFCRPSFGAAVVDLSHRIVEDHAGTRVRKRDILFAVFQCRACPVLYGVAMVNIGQWYGFRCGEHDRTREHHPHPLPDHIKQAVGLGIGLKQSGKDLLEFVRHEVGCDDLSRSTMQTHMDSLPDHDWKVLAAQIPSLTRRWRDAGLKCQEFRDRGVLLGFAMELPTSKFFLSDAFLGVVFVDGCHVSDRLKSTLISIVTITSDRILLPLAVLICPSENKDAYMWLFQFTEPLLPAKYVMMSDQSTSMLAAFPEYFGARPHLEVTRLPCFFHIMQKLQRAISLEIRTILRADHPNLYRVLLANFAMKRKKTYEKLAQPMRDLAYMSPEYKGVFEFIADSPVESFNHAIIAGRSMEPIHLIQTIYNFSLEQVEKQKQRLARADNQRSDYCLTCVAEAADRKSTGAILAVRQSQIRTQYLVSEQFPSGATLDYTVETVPNQVCSCRGYERKGIPCRHMYAVARRFHNVQVPPITDIHKVSVIREGLGTELPSVSFANLEEAANVTLRQPQPRSGRPRKLRLRPFKEYYLIGLKPVTCSACGQKGHTKRAKRCPLHPANNRRAQPEAVQPEAAQPEAVQPEAVQPEAAQPEAVQPEAVQPEAVQPEAVQPEAAQPENPQLETATGKRGRRSKSVQPKSNVIRTPRLAPLSVTQI